MNFNEKLCVTAIFLLGLALRAWNLNSVFLEPDAAMWAIIPIKLYSHPFFTLASPLELNPLAQLAAWHYGYLYPSFLFIWVTMLSLAGLPVNEITLVLPCLFIGSASIIVIYLLTKKLFNRHTAILAASLTAILPLHVGLSRTMITTRMPADFLLLLTIFLFIRHLKSGERKTGWPASISMGLYCVSNPMFLWVFPILFYLSFSYSTSGEGGILQRLKKALPPFFRKEVIIPPFLLLLPPISVFLYGISVDKFGGQIGYMLAKKKVLGIYLESVAGHFVYNIGLALSLLIPFCVVYGSIRILQRKKEEGLLIFWAVVCTFPFIFLVPDKVTGIRAYLLDGTIPLVILVSLSIVRFIHFLKNTYGRFYSTAGIFFLGILIFSTFTSTLHSIFGFQLDGTIIITPYKLQTEEITFGSVRKDNGVKAAGYYVRENVPQEAKVFIDMSPHHGPLYFGRVVYAVLDADTQKILSYLEKNKNKLDVIVINNFHEQDVQKIIGKKFFKIVDIRNANEAVMSIFSKKEEPLKILQVEDVNELFNEKYNEADKLIPQWVNYRELAHPVISFK